jgi:hypothetical protein
MAIDRRPDRRKPWRVRSWETDGRQHSRSFTRKADANADWPRSSTTRPGAIGPTPALGWIASRLGWGSGRRRQITSGPPRRYGIECCWTATCCPGSVRSGGRRAGVSGAGPAWRLWRAADRGDGPLQWWPVAHGKLPYEDLASGDPGHWLGRAAHLRLRHMAVALWIAAGAGPKEVATRAGHSSVSFTLDRYGHLYPEADRALRDRLNRFHEAAGDAE